MLRHDEFVPGTFAAAIPLSLILPRTQDEETVLVGATGGAPAAVFLSGRFRFRYFASADTTNWRGLIIPHVSVEVDETSVFDPDHSGRPAGSVIRQRTELVLYALAERAWHPTAITLHGELSSAGEFKAGFRRWQVVIGEGDTKRVLWRGAEDADGADAS